MNMLSLFLYRTIVAPIGVLFMVTLGSVFIPKVRMGLRLRRARRDWPRFTSQPVWIHAASGEFEYAKPLIRELKKQNPKTPIVVTYFSPSFSEAIKKFPGVDFSLPLPIDLPGPTRQFLKKLNPKCGLIARTDLWPEILHQAHSLHIPLILFSVTKTKRPSAIVRSLYHWLYGYLDAVFTVTDADASVLKGILPDAQIEAIGDTRFDQVLERLNSPKALRTELKPDRQKTLVAGSTWWEDEKVLLEALTPLLRDHKMQLIVAPHEPTPSHLESLHHEFQKRNIAVQFYSRAPEFDSGVLIIDQIGILAELYQWGSMAFIGGSFKKTVHSVMEPLAAGCLTVVGPYHRNNREAIEFQSLKSQGESFVQVARDAKQFREIIENGLVASNLTTRIESIRQAVAARGGATKKLTEFLSRSYRQQAEEPSSL